MYLLIASNFILRILPQTSNSSNNRLANSHDNESKVKLSWHLFDRTFRLPF
jgi:hypothetical protein